MTGHSERDTPDPPTTTAPATPAPADDTGQTGDYGGDDGAREHDTAELETSENTDRDVRRGDE